MAGNWFAYEFQPSFILGFHGCKKDTGEAVLRGDASHLEWSKNDYDWLGHGIYFWEGDFGRAMAWAEDNNTVAKITDPFVLGAIIDLRHCLDLFSRDSLRQVKDAHLELKRALKLIGKPLPQNIGKTPDKAGRRLDCLVMNYLHEYREQRGEGSYDSIRGPFLEGPRLYPRAGFRSQNHIQICVRNTECIKGYFRPIMTAPAS